MAVRLYGRNREAARLHAAVSGLDSRRGSVLVLEGEAGMGKSSLLEETAAALPADQRVVTSSGVELERDVAFGLATRLFLPLIAALDSDARQDLLDGPARVLRGLFAAQGHAWTDDSPAGPGRPVAGALPNSPTDGYDQAAGWTHGFSSLTAALARGRTHGGRLRSAGDRPGLVVVVDDAQWADASTLRWLVRLAADAPNTSVALLLGIRTGVPDTPDRLLDELRARSAGGVVVLGPLEATAAESWIRAERSDATPMFVSACLTASGNNPFYLQELLASGRPGAAADDRAAKELAAQVPDAVLRSVVMRTRVLSDDARALATAVAVLGDRPPLTRAAALAELNLVDAEQAADTLHDARILTSVDPPSVTHPLVRSALLAELAPVVRSRAHQRAADLLRGEGAPVEAVAAHLQRTRALGNPDVVRTLRDAADRAAARGDYDAARRFLDRALAEPPEPDMRDELLVALALVDAAVGAPDAVDRVSEQVQRVSGATRRAAVLHSLARLLFARSEFDAAGDAIDLSVKELEGAGADDVPSSSEDLQLAEVLADQLAIAELSPTLFARLRPRLNELTADPTIGSLADEPAMLSHLAGILAATGAPADRVVSAAQVALAADWDNNRFYGLSTGRAALALIGVDELDLATEPIEQALRRAEEAGSLIGLGFANHWMAALQYYLGNIEEAVRAAQACLDVCSAGWNVCLPWVAPLLAHARIDRGELDAAAAALDLAVSAETGLPGASQGLVLEARGRLALARADPASAQELFVRASALPGRPDLDQPNPLPWRAGAALAAARLGDRDRAAELAGEELARARSVGARRPLGVALRVTGLVTAGPRGLDLLHEAVAVLERSPALLERARALTDLGARLRDAGQDGAAREPLRRGLELAERCGAGAVVARAGEHLRLAGGRRHRRRSAEAETAVDVLTSAERRVVRFAALGVSTPEIAHNLYLSPKTVEWHLANVYRKLGVRSRSELAGIVGDSAA